MQSYVLFFVCAAVSAVAIAIAKYEQRYASLEGSWTGVAVLFGLAAIVLPILAELRRRRP
ncbi:MAG: hypothetical protein KY476_16085 [Planctomycetes bacterium]|nr:hypothetical protein [Planctomycetota bacterium]